MQNEGDNYLQNPGGVQQPPPPPAPLPPQPQPVLPQQPQQQNTLIYAGFWLRWAALFLDVWISAVPSMLISALITLPVAFASGESLSSAFDKPPVAIIFNSLVILFVWAYYVITTYKHGATLGKRVFKLKVIRENGQPLALLEVIIREIPGKIISGLVLAIGYLMAAFSSKKQALHDHLAGTYVVRTEPIDGKTKLAVVLLALLPMIFIVSIIAAILIPTIFFARVRRGNSTQDGSSTKSAILDNNAGKYVSNFALERDATRKSDVRILSAELQVYKTDPKNNKFPDDLNQLLSYTTASSGMKELPVPPSNSEPPSSYGYAKCTSNNTEQAILYTKLEETGNYYIWRSSDSTASDSGSSILKICQ